LQRGPNNPARRWFALYPARRAGERVFWERVFWERVYRARGGKADAQQAAHPVSCAKLQGMCKEAGSTPTTPATSTNCAADPAAKCSTQVRFPAQTHSAEVLSPPLRDWTEPISECQIDAQAGQRPWLLCSALGLLRPAGSACGPTTLSGGWLDPGWSHLGVSYPAATIAAKVAWPGRPIPVEVPASRGTPTVVRPRPSDGRSVTIIPTQHSPHDHQPTPQDRRPGLPDRA